LKPNGAANKFVIATPFAWVATVPRAPRTLSQFQPVDSGVHGPKLPVP